MSTSKPEPNRVWPSAAAAFFLCALLPLLFAGRDGPTYGTDIGELSQRPAFPSRFSPHYFSDIGAWFTARVGFRNFLVDLGTDVNVGLLHQSVNDKTMLGKDDWLFFSDQEDKPALDMNDANGRLRFRPEEIRQIDGNFAMLNAALAACGKTALYVVGPNKQSIYGEFLVDAPQHRQTRLDDTLQRLDASTLSMLVDSRPDLIAAKREQPFPLYSKTDTHWNDLGAFYAYRAIVARLAREGKIDRPELATTENYEIDARAWRGGDLAVQMLFSPWRFSDRRVSLHPKPIIPQVATTVEADGSWTFKNPLGKGRAILFGDSFSPLIPQYLAVHFKELSYQFVALPRIETFPHPPTDGPFKYPLRELRFDGRMIAQHHADVAILVGVERNIFLLKNAPTHIDEACKPPSG